MTREHDTETSVGVSKLSEWHESLVDYLIWKPHATTVELAFMFNRTQSWISSVRNSDAFKDRFASRKDEHFEMVSRTVSEKLEALADLGVEHLTERVEREGDVMSLDGLNAITQLALKSLGFGQRASTATVVDQSTHNTQVVVRDAAALEDARNSMRELRENVLDAKLEPESREKVLDVPLALPATS